jgi:hypothetical protein
LMDARIILDRVGGQAPGHDDTRSGNFTHDNQV